MKQLIATLVACLLSWTLLAQKPSGTVPPDALFSFYADIKGVATRQQIVELVDKIKDRPGVVWCAPKGIPLDYILIKSNVAISQSELKRWINNPSNSIDYFGEGMRGLEELYNKRKQKRKTN